MHVYQGFEATAGIHGGIVAIGNFDGVHLGHRAMIAEAVRRARQVAVPSVALTFDPHPAVLLRGSAPPALTTTERKLELLAETGLDATIVYPTDHALLRLSPGEFFESIVQGTLAVRGLVEGANFRFGHDRAGDVETLRSLCEKAGLSFHVVPAVTIDGRTVSSSEIRRSISRGELRAANRMLGCPYRLRGRVVEGARRGRTIGFPTANLAEVVTLLPPEGVYAGRAIIDARAFPAGINLGPNPTFQDQSRKLEVHLLDFQGNLYGKFLDVELLDRIRDTRPFAGIEQLKEQLNSDMQRVRAAARD